MEVEDSAGGRSAEVERRFARKQLDSPELGVSHWRYAPGYRSRMGDHHREQDWRSDAS
jgi:hypothetical protein